MLFYSFVSLRPAHSLNLLRPLISILLLLFYYYFTSAVDVWACGVILFLMLTGFPPWERPCRTDERFKYMTAGYLVQMLTEWELGLSPDAMDLLQRMMWLDPRDRLSLAQLRAHPWMRNGPAS